MIAALLQLMHGHQYTAFPAITMATDHFSATHPPLPPRNPMQDQLTPPRNSIPAWSDNRWLDSFAAYNSKFNAKTEFDLSFKNLPTETSQFILTIVY